MLDDVIITGQNDEEHINTLTNVLERLQGGGFCLNSNKTRIMNEKFNDLSLTISCEGIWTNPDNIKSTAEVSEPQKHERLGLFICIENL